MNKKIQILVIGLMVVGLSNITVHASIIFNDGSLHEINTILNDTIEVKNNFWNETTTVNLLSGGWVDEIRAYEDSLINVLGGQIGEALFSGSNVYAYDTSRVNFSGGEIVRYLIAEDYGYINFSGGEVGRSMYGYDNSQIAISGGIVQEDLYLYGGATMTDGQIISNIEAFGNIAISGGSVGGNLDAHENSYVYISGGQISGYLGVSFGSTVIMDGMNFVLDGHNVFGEITNPLDEINSGHVTGTYFDNSAVDVYLQMQPGASITFIPEPATICLLGLGGLLLRRKKSA
jgi:hypothetical protein